MKATVLQSLPLLLLIVIIGIIYSPALENGFIDNWDDNYVITNNPDIDGFTIENIKNWFSKGYVGMFQPVTISTLALNYEIGQFEPYGYHLFNLIIFTLIVLLLWRFLYRLTDSYMASIIVTIFFVVHPFSVESVAWVSGRISLMAMLFILITVNYYVSGGRNFLILFTLFLLAVLSKINAIILPVFLLAIDMGQGNEPFSKKNLFPKMGMLLLITPILVFSLTLRVPDRSISIWQLLLNIPAKYLWYINHIFPIYKFSPVYDPPTYLDWKNLTGIMVVVFVIWVFKKASKDNKGLIITGSIIFIVSLVPHMITFSLGAPMGDRYGFMSFIGVAIIMAAVFKNYLHSKTARATLTAIFTLLCIIHSLDAHRYTSKWRSAMDLWEHAAETVPRNAVAHGKLGSWLLINRNYKRAKEELITAVALDPDDIDSNYNLGSLSFYTQSYQDAVDYFTKVYSLENDYKVLIDRARSYYALRDYDNAIKDLDGYIKVYPEATAFFLRGQSKFDSGRDGCADLKMALDLGLNEVLGAYTRNCVNN